MENPTPGEASDRAGRQFSLSGLLLLVTFVAVLMGPMVWLPRPVFAGLVGLASIVVLVVISIFNTRHMIVHIAWWLMLVMYVLCVSAAFIQR